MINIDVLIN